MLSIGERLLSTQSRLSFLLAYALLTVLCAGPARSATVTLVPLEAMKVRQCEAHVVDARGVEIIAPCGQPIRTSSNATVGYC